MLKVKNKKAIGNLANKSFKANSTRNLIAIIAIALTAILFTSLFTMSLGAMDAFQQATMRQSGGDGHGVLKYMTEKQYDDVKDHPLIDELSYCRILCDDLENEEFLKRRAEFWYYDDVGLKLGFVDLADGHKPEKENEVIADTTTLELLGVPREVGAPLSLSLRIRDQVVTRDFVLAGWWESDPAFNVGQIFSSRAYVNAHEDELVNTYYEDYSLAGAINSYIMFKNSFNIEEKLETVITESGYSIDEDDADFIAYNANWAYLANNFTPDLGTVAAIIGGLLLIILTGYLIIYNIFQISVTKDIRFYGLLKTIGTTTKQIRRIIRRQALLLSTIGIPIGLIIGFFIGKSLVPLLINNTAFAGSQYVVSPNPFIFIGAGIFALVTVIISTLKPGRMAAKVSPVEAVRYTEGGEKLRKKPKKTANGGKLSRMALSNLGRNKRRTILVMISLSLSLVLLNTVFTVSRSIDMDEYVSRFCDTDFLAAHADYFNHEFMGVENQASETMINAIEQQPGYEEGGRFYGGREQGFSVRDSKNTTQDYNKNKFGDFISAVYGADDFPLLNLDLIDGELDYEKLMSGDYILEAVHLDDYNRPQAEYSHFKVGDKVTIGRYARDAEGNALEYETREFTVLGHVALKYYTASDGIGWDYNFYLPSAVYKGMVEDPAIMSFVFNVEDHMEGDMEAFLKDYTENAEITMNYSSKATTVASFQDLYNTFLVVGGGLSGIIGLIGILNFINAVLTSIMTRRREFAMLQSIGMTRQQLRKTLIFEGLYYAAGTGLLSLILGVAFSLLVVKPLTGQMWFLSYSFIIRPLVALIPLLFILGAIVPMVCYGTAGRSSVVERLREE
ncbi:MAG: ABC transporter permease [Bacillota bacterium]|nr:ABC transporter permease [Bacillota bacterium]